VPRLETPNYYISAKYIGLLRRDTTCSGIKLIPGIAPHPKCKAHDSKR